MSEDRGVPKLQGDGEPDCPRCRGRGSVQRTYTPEEIKALPPWEIPSTHWDACVCTKARREREALERVWRGYANFQPVARTPLSRYAQKDVLVKSSSSTLRSHLFRVLRDHPNLLRSTRVVSDLDLISAWLATAGLDVLDPEVAGQHRDSEDAFLRLVDLVAPPALLVLRLGVKAARNVAVPEVILEALQCRAHRGRPTWVVEDPYLPFTTGAIFWSPQLVAHMAPWVRVEIDGTCAIEDCVESLDALRPASPQRPSDPDPPAPRARPDRQPPRVEATPSSDSFTLPGGMSIDKKQKTPKKGLGSRKPPFAGRRIREADEA